MAECAVTATDDGAGFVRVLEVSLQKQWPGFALDVAFRAESGATVLFGPSGSGKTLIVKAVAGLGRPDHGRIVLGERVLLDTKAGVTLPPEARRVGVVFQEPRLFPHMSVERNLLYGWRLLAAEARPNVAEVVALLGVDHLLKRRPNRLSGGEKQRVAIGRALLAAPELLIMDEPLANLDQGRKDEILPFLARLKTEARIPILYVTHAQAEADVLADRIVHIADGALLEIEER